MAQCRLAALAASFALMARSRSETYTLVVARDDGLFSNLYSVLGALEWCQNNGGAVAVRFDDGLYLDPAHGPNWWEYYFERLSEVDPMTLPVANRKPLLQQSQDWAYRSILRRKEAAALIKRYIHLRPEVTEGLDLLWDACVGERFAVGMHLRGTDKFIEGLEIDLEEAFRYLEYVVRGRSPDSWRVFIATDEALYLELARARFGEHVVSLDALRSTTRQPLHREITPQDWAKGPYREETFVPMHHYPPYRLGLEALRDATMLSRCNVFIGSQSNLSYFVGHSNPSVPWIHVGGTLPAASDQFAAALQRNARERNKPTRSWFRRLWRRGTATTIGR